MITQTINPHYFDQKALQIRAQVSTVLAKWGLLPRFKRWRLTQDPGTGMIVLFGILNNKYIATPFSDYLDPRLLDDLANELHVQVVSCKSDGLRYAFILDRGEFGKLPSHLDFPLMDNGKRLVQVVYSDQLPSIPAPPVEVATVDDHMLVEKGVGAFLKVFDDIKLREDAALQFSAQNSPAVVVKDEDEFKKRVAEQEANEQKLNSGLHPHQMNQENFA